MNVDFEYAAGLYIAACIKRGWTYSAPDPDASQRSHGGWALKTADGRHVATVTDDGAVTRMALVAAA